MSFDLQPIIVALAVATASLYVVAVVFRRMRSKSGKACGSACSGCKATDPSTTSPLVTLSDRPLHSTNNR